MSKIEMKLIFDTEKNPVINILEFNDQIVKYLQAIIDYKEKQDPMEFINKNKPEQFLHHAGGILLLKRFIYWFSAINLIISSSKSANIIAFDTLLRKFTFAVIKKEDEKKKNKSDDYDDEN